VKATGQEQVVREREVLEPQRTALSALSEAGANTSPQQRRALPVQVATPIAAGTRARRSTGSASPVDEPVDEPPLVLDDAVSATEARWTRQVRVSLPCPSPVPRASTTSCCRPCVADDACATVSADAGGAEAAAGAGAGA
jgi:hypothetical protein